MKTLKKNDEEAGFGLQTMFQALDTLKLQMAV